MTTTRNCYSMAKGLRVLTWRLLYCYPIQSNARSGVSFIYPETFAIAHHASAITTAVCPSRGYKLPVDAVIDNLLISNSTSLG